MSFSDPVKCIDHIPPDFDTKANGRHRKMTKPETIWKVIAIVGALGIIFGALITGEWER